jgi:carbonic anhydrase
LVLCIGKHVQKLNHLFENNRTWAAQMRARDAEFFVKLARQQSPAYLWIGCSDSRVPANEIVGLAPGELFVHRNVANVVVHTDLNCLSVIQYAVDVLKVSHIIVCGHYGCGGVRAALRNDRLGLIDNWLRNVQDAYHKHHGSLAPIIDEAARGDRLGELNVIEQVLHVCETTIARDAWARGQELAVHGWIYGLDDGHLRDLHICVARTEDIGPSYQAALAALQPGGPR